MAGQPPGPMVRAVLRLLRRHRELTRAEICMLIGLDRQHVSAVISRMARPCKTLPKRIYVKHWVRDDGTRTRRYPKAVYALGDLADAPKPPPKTSVETSREWRQREKGRVNSVFMWQQPRHVRYAMRRGETP